MSVNIILQHNLPTQTIKIYHLNQQNKYYNYWNYNTLVRAFVRHRTEARTSHFGCVSALQLDGQSYGRMEMVTLLHLPRGFAARVFALPMLPFRRR